ncbi:hypothetical protein HHI36_013392 [Cryptolaemus montrouzieri]|uniref:BESS domain-containing protein n=1 Tax=Cryptolaemus montrouzieri TaxID=559131 RepID=A0ABD2NH72_9CUCU
MKFKKGSKGEIGQANGYCKWPWRRHMSFIGDTFLYRQYSSNIPEDIQSENDIPSSVRTSASSSSTKENIEVSKCLRRLQCGGENNKFKKNEKPNENQMDGIDHLFFSYAATFKTFRPKTQVILKLKLAALFAETEILVIQEQKVPLTSLSSSFSSEFTTNYEISEEYSRGSALSASSDNASNQCEMCMQILIIIVNCSLVLILC